MPWRPGLYHLIQAALLMAMLLLIGCLFLLEARFP